MGDCLVKGGGRSDFSPRLLIVDAERLDCQGLAGSSTTAGSSSSGSWTAWAGSSRPRRAAHGRPGEASVLSFLFFCFPRVYFWFEFNFQLHFYMYPSIVDSFLSPRVSPVYL